jgi:RNA polymerase sigma-70 factor (ECF subfamily)
VDLLEKQVLETLQLGNESAFEMIFRTYYQPLCRYAYSFLQDKEEAEEVVQSSFITVWDKRNSLTIETSVKSYLYRMVRNSCLNVIKHEKIKQQHVAHELAVADVSHESVSQKVHAAELEIKISRGNENLARTMSTGISVEPV